MPGHPRRRWTTVPAAFLLAVAVAGCSGGTDVTDTADTSPTPSATEPTSSPTAPTAPPSPTATPEPKLPKAPPAKDTAAGREAFAEFVIDRWGYALSTNDATALSDLSLGGSPCGGCPELEQELRTRTKEGWHVDFPGARIVKLRVEPGDEPGVQVATATINVPASESYFDDGELRNENKAHKGASFEVRMKLDGKRYALLAFRVS